MDRGNIEATREGEADASIKTLTGTLAKDLKEVDGSIKTLTGVVTLSASKGTVSVCNM